MTSLLLLSLLLFDVVVVANLIFTACAFSVTSVYVSVSLSPVSVLVSAPVACGGIYLNYSP